MKTKYFGADGVVHTVRLEDKAPRLDHSPKFIEKMNRERKICLNCTKKKCSGYCEYFKK